MTNLKFVDASIVHRFGFFRNVEKNSNFEA